MFNWPDMIFTLVFLCQVFLISWIIPNKLISRIRYVLDTYPESEYPKLYPKPHEKYERWLSLFRIANRIIFLLGFVVLYVALTRNREEISDVFPGVYFIIQFIPLMAMELMEFGNFKLMRKKDTSGKRKAELRRRNLFRYVSPWLVTAAAVSWLSFIAVEIWLPNQVFEWDKVIALSIGVLFLVLIGAWALRGRKLDPHQDAGDRAKQISTTLHAMGYLITAACAFTVYKTVEDAYAIASHDAIAMSIYMQIVALLSIGTVLREVDPRDLDFSVYRKGTEPESNGAAT